MTRALNWEKARRREATKGARPALRVPRGKATQKQLDYIAALRKRAGWKPRKPPKTRQAASQEIDEIKRFLARDDPWWSSRT